MGLLGNIFKIIVSGNLLASASDEELSESYEKLRLEWLKDQNERTNQIKRNNMHVIDREMVRRANEKYEKEHPNAETQHREHGWYLPNDD